MRFLLPLIFLLLASPAAAQYELPDDSTPPDFRLKIKTTTVDPDRPRLVFLIHCRERSEPCAGTLRLRTASKKPYTFGRVHFKARRRSTQRVVFRFRQRAPRRRLLALMEAERARLSARAQVYDKAGNRTRRTLIFTAQPRQESSVD